MTTRELYNSMLNLIRDTEDVNVSELEATLIDALAKMDAQNEARRAKNAEKSATKQAEKEPIRKALLEVMGDETTPKTASMLIEEAGLIDTVKPASVPSLLRPLVEEGIVIKVDVKIPGKGTQRGYVKG